MVPKLTAQGYNLLVNALDGTGLHFTQIKIGNGGMPDNYVSLTDIVNPLVSVGIATITKADNYVILRAPMSNSDLDDGFDMTEMGVFVANPDGGEDILYAYAHYKLSGDAAAIHIPPVTSNLVEITHNVHVFIGELDNVTAILAESSEYATAKDLDDHLKDTNNPHKVGKKEVGLENVPNVTPENQQPVFSGTVTVVDTDASGNKSLPNIASGEKMGSILQKIRSAIAAFVSHINEKNPHGMDTDTIGAAKKSHYHSANDINSGTLGIARGGTGATTAKEALRNLGLTVTAAELNSMANSMQRGTLTGTLDEGVINGVWWCNFANITGGPVTSGYGVLERYGMLLRVTMYDTGKIYSRMFVNNTWTGWMEA